MSKKRKMKNYISGLLTVICCLFYCGQYLAAQDGRTGVLVSQADSLRSEYLFAESVEACREALASEADTAVRMKIEDKLLLGENGISMSSFVSTPSVVARHKFSIDEFYLFYPLQDRSWRPAPNLLDTLGTHPFSKAAYVPEGSREIYFSAPDQEGAMNIYRTELKDTVWSLPALINEDMTSSSDEIYPMLSPDGKSLFFASSGLYGVGGYDLYMSSWDEDKGEWGVPVNMGFPYSSPYDDFLFINTPDGKYSIFASNRDCSADSVYVYVLEYDSMPVRREVKDASALREICRLLPDGDHAGVDSGTSVPGVPIPESMDTRKYMDKMSEVRSLKDSLFSCMSQVDRFRADLASESDGDARRDIEAELLEYEALIPVLQDTLNRASAELQKIEMEFLFNGVVIDPDKIGAEADRKVVGASSGFAFTEKIPGGPLSMKFEVPEKKFDYSFMVLPEGRFAEDNKVPDGLVYQIQIFTLSRHATVAQLNGLSPVFESRTPTGKYTYRVGVFRTYNDVLSRLNTVKKAGFKTAYIVPLKDGKVIKMAEAKAMEAAAKPVYQLNMLPEAGTLPDIALKAVNQAGAKDVAKMEQDGKTVFTAGPFYSLRKAEETAAAVRAAGVQEVSVIKIGNITSK